MRILSAIPGHGRILAAALLALCPAAAQQNGGAPEFGFEQRTRNENWNNLFDYSGKADDEREQLRLRTRAWARVPLPGGIEINAGVNSETNLKFGQKKAADELVFETANIYIRRLGLRGLSLKAGRQDLMRGEGLLLFEGTPGDGSRSMYFNAAVLSYAFRKTTIEAIGIVNPRCDRMLPRLHGQNRALIEWDEQALGLYLTDSSLPGTSLEGYFFHKKEVRDARGPSHPQFQPDRRVETAGGRIRRKIDAHWTVTAEMAHQRGLQRPSTPISAWGGYAYATRNFTARFQPYATAGYWALSGDDPAHPERIGGWDPLFARWPRWGDLELYSQLPEKGVGYATNQKRLHLEGGFTPRKGVNLKFVFYELGAFHPFAGKPAVFGKGTSRGRELQARMDFQANRWIRGHVDFETLLPGDFYAERGRAYFLRFELIAQVKGSASRLFGRD